MTSPEKPKENAKRTELVKEMPRQWRDIRERVLKEVPSQVEDLNMERIESFFDSFGGLKTKDVVVVGEADFGKMRELLGEMLSEDIHSFFKPPESEFEIYNAKGEAGMYIPEIDLSLVKRDAGFEKCNGAFGTETLVVHEKAHSATGYDDYLHESPDMYYKPRSGLRVRDLERDWGSFFEEGFADVMRGEYVKRFAPANFREQLMRTLQYDRESSLDAITAMSDPASEGLYPLPIKYLLLGRAEIGRELVVPTAPIAAFGLELLQRKNGELQGALFRSRSNIEGLREVARIVNGLKRGLYTKLQKLPYTEVGFIEGLKMIIDELYGGGVSVNKVTKEILS